MQIKIDPDAKFFGVFARAEEAHRVWLELQANAQAFADEYARYIPDLAMPSPVPVLPADTAKLNCPYYYGGWTIRYGGAPIPRRKLEAMRDPTVNNDTSYVRNVTKTIEPWYKHISTSSAFAGQAVVVNLAHWEETTVRRIDDRIFTDEELVAMTERWSKACDQNWWLLVHTCGLFTDFQSGAMHVEYSTLYKQEIVASGVRTR
jgi:hypothetical protein